MRSKVWKNFAEWLLVSVCCIDYSLVVWQASGSTGYLIWAFLNRFLGLHGNQLSSFYTHTRSRTKRSYCLDFKPLLTNVSIESAIQADLQKLNQNGAKIKVSTIALQVLIPHPTRIKFKSCTLWKAFRIKSPTSLTRKMVKYPGYAGEEGVGWMLELISGPVQTFPRRPMLP